MRRDALNAWSLASVSIADTAQDSISPERISA